MKLRSLLNLTVFALGGMSLAHGTINLYFSKVDVDFSNPMNPAFVAKVLHGFENDAVNGTPTDGMAWGVVVFTDGDLQSNLNAMENLRPFDSSVSGQYLNEAESLWYVLGSSGLEYTETFINDLVPDTYAGSIASVEEIDFTGLTPGAQFAVIWFPQHEAGVSSGSDSGDSYGFITVADFVLPPDRDSGFFYDVNYDPSNINGSFSPVWQFAIPEPSTYALAVAGLLAAVVVLRRRKG